MKQTEMLLFAQCPGSSVVVTLFVQLGRHGLLFITDGVV